MTTNLSELVPVLERELAVPGEFATAFPNTTPEHLLESLKDAFAEARLFGYFPKITLDENGIVSEDLSLAGQTLVVLYAAMRIIRAQIRQLNTTERYKAGSAEMEIGRPVTILRDELAFMAKRLSDLVTTAKRSGRAVYVMDGYTSRLPAVTQLGGFAPYEWK